MKPILFNTEMVKAIIEGKKTQTRRVLKFPPNRINKIGDKYFGESGREYKPKYSVGDILWVRETWNLRDGEIVYKASPDLFKKTSWYKEINKAFRISGLEMPEPEKCIKWKPSIFMPKDACRLFLNINELRTERLQNISEQDAIAEGVKNLEETILWYNYIQDRYTCGSAIESYKSLWQKINGVESWEENPIVWVATFATAECPQGFC